MSADSILASCVLAWSFPGDYTTRVVLLGTMLLGFSAGMVGTFLLMRKRSLVGDVASHAALPGIGLAYLILEWQLPGQGRWFPGLLLGAALAASLGIWITTQLQRVRLIKEDAALAIVLSVFFGIGVTLLTVIQSLPTGTQARLSDYLFGRAASLLAADVTTLSIVALVVLVATGALFKELTVLAFDEAFAAAQGWPVMALELVLTGLVVLVTVTGMQSVGLLLAVALLITPAIAARFWTDRLSTMVILSGLIGAASAAAGVLLSAQYSRLATGAVIVLCGTVAFVVSWIVGRQHGLLWDQLRLRKLRRQIAEADLLRAFYEILESRNQVPSAVTADPLASHAITQSDLQKSRHWTTHRFGKILSDAMVAGLLRFDPEGHYRLTATGARQAIEVVRHHRLWELYLLQYADVQTHRVDQTADITEHGLSPEEIDRLERLILKEEQPLKVPESPHREG